MGVDRRGAVPVAELRATMMRSDRRKRLEEEALAAQDVSATDWRGTPIKVGDMVVFAYGWGGQKLALCEGEITRIDTEADSVRIDLHYDNGDYQRKQGWALRHPMQLTRVDPR